MEATTGGRPTLNFVRSGLTRSVSKAAATSRPKVATQLSTRRGRIATIKNTLGTAYPHPGACGANPRVLVWRPTCMNVDFEREHDGREPSLGARKEGPRWGTNRSCSTTKAWSACSARKSSEREARMRGPKRPALTAPMSIASLAVADRSVAPCAKHSDWKLLTCEGN